MTRRWRSSKLAWERWRCCGKIVSRGGFSRLGALHKILNRRGRGGREQRLRRPRRRQHLKPRRALREREGRKENPKDAKGTRRTQRRAGWCKPSLQRTVHCVTHHVRVTLHGLCIALMAWLGFSGMAFGQAVIPEWCRPLPRPEYKSL